MDSAFSVRLFDDFDAAPESSRDRGVRPWRTRHDASLIRQSVSAASRRYAQTSNRVDEMQRTVHGDANDMGLGRVPHRDLVMEYPSKPVSCYGLVALSFGNECSIK